MTGTRRGLLVAVLGAGCGLVISGAAAATPPLRVLCTTFPVYQLTRNVSQGRERVTVTLLLPAALGCPHDYALTPQDMRRLSRADVLVVNGLGLEEFLGAPIREANPKVLVVEPAAGIRDTLAYGEPEAATGGDEGHDHAAGHDEAGHDAEGHDHGHDEPGHEHAHTGVNPHLFASPRQAARLALAIAEGLAKADPEGAALYRQNAEAHAVRLNRLADDLASLGASLTHRRIVTQHGVFDYLARDMGLEVVATVQAHAGQEPSAAAMIHLVKTIRERGAVALFTEPQYPSQTGQTIAREAGIRTARLDPVASGPQDAPLDYYETTMRRNLDTLKTTLGAR